MRGVLVFASNTDCGKTLASAGIVRAALARKLGCVYIKPVQTGVESDNDTDAARVRSWSRLSTARTLFSFKDPVSPHLAAQREKRTISSFEIREKLSEALNTAKVDFSVVETAGGVLSPFPDETLAADALQLSSSKLRLRTVLVGDSKLGGVSQTMAALEALEARHYDVCSMLLFSTDESESRYGNFGYLSKRLVKNPPVRRMPLAIPQQGDIPKSFFEHPVFDEVLHDILDVDHDKRTM
jgi:dethiobiotin synthetase/adenosylmethionine--8-amino-7-oxononanoate aminotransferase